MNRSCLLYTSGRERKSKLSVLHRKAAAVNQILGDTCLNGHGYRNYGILTVVIDCGDADAFFCPAGESVLSVSQQKFLINPIVIFWIFSMNFTQAGDPVCESAVQFLILIGA